MIFGRWHGSHGVFKRLAKALIRLPRMRRLVCVFAGRTYLIVGNVMSWLKYVRHCLCNALYVYCRGRAVTNVGKTCGPTPCFVLVINTFKLNIFQNKKNSLRTTFRVSNGLDPDEFVCKRFSFDGKSHCCMYSQARETLYTLVHMSCT